MRQYAILNSDPTARLIVGNVDGAYRAPPDTGCAYNQGSGGYWLSHFITDGHNIGITVTDFIAGYGFHAYGMNNDEGIGGAQRCADTDAGLVLTTTDPCLTKNFTLTVQTAKDWLTDNDPSKELWMTEFNWSFRQVPGDTYTNQATRMGEMCDQLKIRPATRYGRYTVEPDDSYVSVLDLFLQNPYTGALFPSGVRYTTC